MQFRGRPSDEQNAHAPSAPVVAVEVYRLSQPLTVPYHLSFGTFHQFDVFLVKAEAEDGRTAWGETTACAGYVPETGDEIWDFLCAHIVRVPGMPPRSAISDLVPHARQHGYPAAALLTALEGLAEDFPEGPSNGENQAIVPLVGILSSDHEAELESSFWAQVEKGHTTIKVKVGFDVESDIRRVLFVQGLARQAPGVLIRIDANQGYTPAQAERFVRSVSPDRVQHFEQPFAPGDWDSQVTLSRFSPLPLMLDESILAIEDVERTAALRCAQIVKFKLMKAGGMKLLLEQIALARRLGLQVVLGNGVSGEIGCYHEALGALAGGVELAGEGNGYLKLSKRVLAEPLPTAGGGIVVRRDYRPEPSPDRLSALTVDHRSWRA